VIELEGDAHLGEHFVVALEREQCLPEDHAALDGRRSSEQTQTADLDGLLELPGVDQRLAFGREVLDSSSRFLAIGSGNPGISLPRTRTSSTMNHNLPCRSQVWMAWVSWTVPSLSSYQLILMRTLASRSFFALTSTTS
jgi:hypothetical protein